VNYLSIVLGFVFKFLAIFNFLLQKAAKDSSNSVPVESEAESRYPKKVIKRTELDDFLFKFHDELLHPGWVSTYNNCSNFYWFPKMELEIRGYVANCTSCKKVF
jgi:hypothetical protein